jgi:WD40 repeat protein
MPKGKSPLAASEVGLISAWIQQGAHDDTPPDAKRHFDAEHPPLYSRPPVVPSIDFSPDGKLLAVAGFHEVLMYSDQGATLAGRLIGLSERVQSLRFSPDGSRLAVAGGILAGLGRSRFGMLRSASWSSRPDQLRHSVRRELVARRQAGCFGCADNNVRAIEATSGKQVLQMGSHSDWALSTAFSVKGDHIISGGRDMSVKLTDVASQRFIDNITSITPGALKGGILGLATHPYLDHIVAAGSDGVPRAYRIFREVSREIGDDAQLIADLFPMTGRVFSVRFSLDGKRIACGSGLDRSGELLVCSYEYTNDVPRYLRQIMGKVPDTRKGEEKQKLEDFKNQGIHELARVSMSNSTIYSVAFTPDGGTVATAGSDGLIRFFNATNGALVKEFVSVPLAKDALPETRPAWGSGTALAPVAAFDPESLAEGARVAALEIQPRQIRFSSRNDYAQLLVIARLESGDTADVTRMVKFTIKPSLAEVSSTGLLTPRTNGAGTISVSLAGKSSEIPLAIGAQTKPFHADFVRDVSPILSHLGCNAGTCHGAKEGKNGFKLSLRGYDPETDLRSLTDDLAARRINFASPDESLMLLKAVAEVPHEGGRRTTVDSKYYQVLRQWIANGATLDAKSPRVTKIEVLPQDPVVQQIGSRQQMRVVATYADGAFAT